MLLQGYWASGMFANRFAVLHPVRFGDGWDEDAAAQVDRLFGPQREVR